MKAVDAYILSNQYTDDTANQFGGLKGANVMLQDVSFLKMKMEYCK